MGRRCAEAARAATSGARVVILGGVSPESPVGPAGAPSPELLMLVLVGGKDRTLTQFRALAGEAGLSVRTAGKRASGRFAVECVCF